MSETETEGSVCQRRRQKVVYDRDRRYCMSETEGSVCQRQRQKVMYVRDRDRR